MEGRENGKIGEICRETKECSRYLHKKERCIYRENQESYDPKEGTSKWNQEEEEKNEEKEKEKDNENEKVEKEKEKKEEEEKDVEKKYIEKEYVEKKYVEEKNNSIEKIDYNVDNSLRCRFILKSIVRDINIHNF